MTAMLQSLLVRLLTDGDKCALVERIEYLVAENRMLREQLPKRIILTPRERQRLLRFGKPLGAAIKDLITIVSARTFARWVKEETAQPGKPTAADQDKGKGGRPPVAEELRDLVLKMARASSWGSKRIYGELKKLGYGDAIKRSTVVNILRQHGFETGPERGDRHLGQLPQDPVFRHRRHRLLHQEGLDDDRSEGLLHPVLHQPPHAPRVLRRLHHQP